MIVKDIKRFLQLKNIGYLIIKHKNIISVILAIISLTFGTIGFIRNSNGLWLSVLNSIKLFGLDFPTKPENLNWYIDVAIILVIITLTFTIALIFIKDGMERFQRYISFRNDHIAVFGLGEASVSFLRSYSKGHREERIVIIESDPNNKKLDEYRNLGYGVLVGDSLSESILQRLNFDKMKYALIAMGSDGLNIELAKSIIKKYKAKEIKTSIKLIVHILNPDLDTLFIQNLEDIKPDKHNINLKLSNKKEETDEEENSKFKIDIKTFSFFNEAAEALFEEHYIDGDSSKYMLSGETFKSILIGNGELIKSVIYQIALLSHMPEENIHEVYIVDKCATDSLMQIKKRLHYSKAKFPKLNIIAIDIDKDSNEYFTNSIWSKENIVNIIIAYDNEADNLNLAIELFNRTFKSKAVENNGRIPKIIFAIYNQLFLSMIINSNKEAFKHFYTFGNSEKVLSYTSLIEEEKDMLAQLIHSGYNGAYKHDKLNSSNMQILAKWYDTTEYADRLSNIAQAKHIDMKLKAMGFRKRYVFEKTNDSLTVSFIGKKSKLEDEVMSKELFKRYVPANNSNSSENISMENQIRYYNLNKKATKNVVKKEEQQLIIKKILLSINRDLLTKKFEKDRIPSNIIDDNQLKKYTEKMTLHSNIKKEYSDKLETEIDKLEKEFEKTKQTPEDKLKHSNAKKDACDKSEEDCLNELKGKGLDNIDAEYFPQDFDTLFEKMIRVEHNRWMAYHYLNGWEYSQIKNKAKKEHNCLIPLEDFNNDAMKKAVIYDMYSFLYLPNYLAEAGYEMIPITTKKKKIN